MRACRATEHAAGKLCMLLCRLRTLINAALIASLFFAPLHAFAAATTGMSDAVSSHTAGAGSDHAVQFTTPTGVDASTDTITLDFAGFSLTGVGVGDVDLIHGPTGTETNETLAASAAAGVWGVGFSGTTITFTAPTDAAVGEIAANDIVLIRIGQNATGGANRITNPATEGGYELVIDGTFGDDGRIGLAVAENDDVNVSATVAASATPSVPPGPGPGDITPPAIINVVASTTSFTTVRITWQTDEPATSYVDYGHDMAYASGTVSDLTFVYNHTIDVSGLIPCTTYHFRVRSADWFGNQAQSLDGTFTMPCDTVAPVISTVRAENITDNSATILWSTNEPATSLVQYGTSTAYGNQSSVLGYVNGHAVPLQGLQPNTLYHFRAISTDPSGNTTVSGDYTFTTLGDRTPPANAILVATPGNGQVQLTWTLPSDPDLAGVRIVRKLGSFPTGPNDGVLIYNGMGTSFPDLGLQNGTTYYYGAYVYDATANFASGALALATPFGPGQPPVVVPPTPPGQPTGPVLPPGTVPAGPSATTTSPTPGATIELQLFGAGGTLPLAQGSDGTFGTIAGGHLVARVPADSMNGIPEIVTFSIDGGMFSLTYDARLNAYVGGFIAPRQIGLYEARVQSIFTDGRIAQTSVVLKIQEAGRVFERPLIGVPTTPVPDATVRVLLPNGSVWDGGMYGQQNPVQTNNDGSYAFEVPPGWYRVEVSKPGYETFTSEPFFSDGNLINLILQLIPLPRPPEVIAGSGSSTIEQGFATLLSIGEWLGYWIRRLWEFLSLGSTRDAIANFLGWLLALALLVAMSAIPMFDLRMFGQWLLGAMIPFLLWWRHKHADKQGTVYDAATKLPVDLALVRLVHAPTGLQVLTTVTDAVGRYALKIKKTGTYLIKIVKPGYVFPSELLNRVEEDGEYRDLYYGSRTKITETGLWAPHVPVDPDIPAESVAQARWRQGVRRAQHLILLGGALMGPLLFIAAPSWRAAAIAVILAGVYLLFRRLVIPPPIIRTGRVYDEKTGKSISGAVIRLLDKKSGVLAERQVSDRRGRYGFHAGRNTFSIAVDAPGYVPVTLVDVAPSGTEWTISRDVALTRDTQYRKGRGLAYERLWEGLKRILKRR